MQHGDRRVRGARPAMPADLPRDNPHERPAIRRAHQRHIAGPEVLIARRGQFVPPRQVDPQLQSMEQPTAGDQVLRRRLDVEDPRAGGHPLGRAVGDRPAPAVGVGVHERPVDDVGHGLEAAVRVPGRALGLPRRVVHLAHLVHHDERIEQPKVHACEGPLDREALALKPVRRLHAAHHRPDPCVRRGCRERGQDREVRDGDSGHGRLLLVIVANSTVCRNASPLPPIPLGAVPGLGGSAAYGGGHGARDAPDRRR